MPPLRRAPNRHCLQCDYILDLLPTQQCPECGRHFDLADPTTYRLGPPPSAAKLLAAYLIPFAIGMLFWTVIGAGKWQRSGTWPPLSNRIVGALYQQLGPFAWTIRSVNVWMLAGVVAAVWVSWLLIVLRTRLARLPVSAHITLAQCWCLSGCLRVSVWV